MPSSNNNLRVNSIELILFGSNNITREYSIQSLKILKAEEQHYIVFSSTSAGQRVYCKNAFVTEQK